MWLILKTGFKTLLFFVIGGVVLGALIGKDAPQVPAPTISSPRSGPSCIERGIAYYKEIGSYLRLHSTGELAEEVVTRRCARAPNTAF